MSIYIYLCELKVPHRLLTITEITYKNVEKRKRKNT